MHTITNTQQHSLKINTPCQRHTFKWILTWFMLGLSTALWAQNAGVVEFSRGVGFAQLQGQMPRTLGKGLLLNEGDRLTTSEGATAIIKLNDGTRMTLRPRSEIVVQHGVGA